jgi:hypothetical protein
LAGQQVSATELTVDALAAYRLTRLFISDGVLERPRRATRASLEQRGHRKMLQLSECPWCLGMWIAGAVVLVRRVAPATWSPVATALALSATSGLLASFVREADDEHRVVEQVMAEDTPTLAPSVVHGQTAHVAST